MNLSVELVPKHRRGLLLANPVMTAAGTFGYGTEYSELIDIQRLGAIVCKGTTLHPREGNPQPRLLETTAGLLNSVGLENIGVETLIAEKAPLWAKWSVPVIVNIAGETIEEYAQVASKLDGVAGISALEVNISCPNLAAGGIQFGIRAETAAKVTAAVKAETSFPVIVKLTPSVSDIVEIAIAVVEAGADAICLINTLPGMAIDIARGKPFLGAGSGGLSGPAMKPVAVYMVYKVAQTLDVPIIGCGGISSASDALEFIMAGARAIQVGTTIFSHPQTPLTILEGIENFMRRNGISKVADLIGIALPHNLASW